MDTWNAPTVQSRQLLTYRFWKAWAWEAQNDLEAADREGLQRVKAQLSTLMMETPGDLV